jgi:hypothetical protein
LEKQKLKEIETLACGPDCACNAPPKGKKIKIAISLIAAAGIAGILAFKFFNKSFASNDPSTAQASTFFLDQAARDAENQPLNDMEAQAVKDRSKIGEYLESLSDLNRVALSQDAVFIFIPRDKNELVNEQTIKAAFSAKKILKDNRITLGLYTLSAGSPDYAGISRQVQAPAILVATKGKGMAAVTGDITESKLLQAFVNTSRAGGCCPPGGNKKPADCVTK